MITLTMNPQHFEILKRIEAHFQTAFTRPDITSMVFHYMLSAFLKKVRTVLGRPLGGVAWMLHVVEFQKRGLPHAHILLCTERVPTMEELPNYISAELPPEGFTEEEQEENHREQEEEHRDQEEDSREREEERREREEPQGGSEAERVEARRKRAKGTPETNKGTPETSKGTHQKRDEARAKNEKRRGDLCRA